MLAKKTSCTVVGVEGWLVDVEVDVSRGLPVYSTVGLPDGAVRESKDRVKAAIKNCGYEFPAKKITVNLSPADIKKEGTAFDLPIALGVLEATGLFSSENVGEYCIMGELSLDGKINRVRGVLPALMEAKNAALKGAIIPEENRAEAQLLAGDIEVILVTQLQEVVEFFAGTGEAAPLPSTADLDFDSLCERDIDFSEVKGQPHVRRGLEIAAAGGHNILPLCTIACNVFLLCMLVAGNVQAKHLHKEAWYQERWCKEHNGQMEYRLPDRSRVDCLTDKYAVEFDFANKWSESAFQALYYSLQTGKQAAIGLIMEKPSDYRYWIKLNTVIEHHKLPIETFTVQP